MSTSPAYESWTQDPDLYLWICGVQFRRPHTAPRFVNAMASAARHADATQYAALRPLLLKLKAAHPEFDWKRADPKTLPPASE